MKLNEISGFNQEALDKWLDNHAIAWKHDYKFENGVVNNIESDTKFSYRGATAINHVPFKLGKVLSFDCSGQFIDSIDFFPDEAGGNINLEFCDRIESFKGIGTKVLKKMGTAFSDGAVLYATGMNIKRNALGLLKIEGLRKIEWKNGKNKEWGQAVMIINKHLNQGKAGIIAAQQELIDVDLEEYAEL